MTPGRIARRRRTGDDSNNDASDRDGNDLYRYYFSAAVMRDMHDNTRRNLAGGVVDRIEYMLTSVDVAGYRVTRWTSE